MDHERLGVPHVRKVARQLEVVYDTTRDVGFALDPKAQHAPERVMPQQPFRRFVVLVVRQARIRYPSDLGMFMEPSTQRVNLRQ